MKTFADRLQNAIDRNRSFLIAGFDPKLEDLPADLLAKTKEMVSTRDELIYEALLSFFGLCMEGLEGKIAGIKPNIAFFEQYGPAGVNAFADVVKLAKKSDVLVIADGKRGDIGSTAEAYSAAFLGQTTPVLGDEPFGFNSDALTVNPFLGFDTLEPFIKDCKRFGKGIFVLVRTSNPGSAKTQGSIGEGSLSESIAAWIGTRSTELMGECGFSGLGAVVGATFPEDARKLRLMMPNSFFLIPGMGAQGASAKDALAGFSHGARLGGGVVNVSRGLLGGLKSVPMNDARATISRRADEFNKQIAEGLT